MEETVEKLEDIAEKSKEIVGEVILTASADAEKEAALVAEVVKAGE